MFGQQMFPMIASDGNGAVDFLFEWFVVVILFLPFLLALIVTFRRSANPGLRFRNVCGILLGLVVVAGVVMRDRGGNFAEVSWLTGSVSSKVLFGAGFVGSLMLLLVLDKFAIDRVLPILVGLLTAATWISVYAYVSTEAYRDSMSTITWGVLVGGLIYAIMFAGAHDMVSGRRSRRTASEEEYQSL